MRKCELCGVETNVKEAILDSEIMQLCDRCILVEGAVVVERPTAEQLASINKATSIYARLRKAAGLPPLQKEKTVLQAREIRPRVWRTTEELKKQKSMAEMLAENAESAEKKSESETKKLIPVKNFPELIIKARTRKGLTQKQLADALVETEYAIIQAEKGKLPTSQQEARNLLRKLEQFFFLKLIEQDFTPATLEIQATSDKEAAEELDKLKQGKINFRSKLLTLAHLRKATQQKKIEAENLNQKNEEKAETPNEVVSDHNNF